MILFSVIFISGCISQQQGGLREYEESSYSISYPGNWAKNKGTKFDVIFLAPRQDDFSANLGITVASLSEEEKSQTLDEIVNIIKQLQSEDYPEYKVISENHLTVSDKSAFKRVYDWYSSEYKLDVTQIQVFLIKDDTSYIITATSLSDKFDEYEPTFMEMINSFQLK